MQIYNKHTMIIWTIQIGVNSSITINIIKEFTTHKVIHTL